MTIKKATKEERERLRKLLAENPRLIHPTGKRDTSPFEPIEIRGKPLSQTIIEERR